LWQLDRRNADTGTWKSARQALRRRQSLTDAVAAASNVEGTLTADFKLQIAKCKMWPLFGL
jgi:hypothetical protein